MIEATSTTPRTEGPVAKAIERQTSKVPSDIFLWTALGFLGISAFKSMSRRQEGQFMSQLAPTLLLLGVYNKIVKIAGSDRFDQGGQFARPGVVR
ncbi:MAG TPA: hypothetical protein VFP58_11745 [Candidatus Eisenbacteria bacterium]|nr:hypothetical protein [Candidatus Eisenbacteria bacterium]